MNSSSMDRYAYFITIIMTFLMPLSRKFIPPLIVCLGLIWLLNGSLKDKVKNISRATYFLFPFFFYLLHMAGLLYSSNLRDGFFDLEVKFSVLLFPVLIFGLPPVFKRNRDSILLSFVLGNLVAFLISVIYALYRTLKYNSNLFSYGDFSLFMHTSYASMYALFSLSIIAIFILNGKSFPFVINKWLSSVVILFLCIIIYLLSSRAGYVALIIFLITIVFFEFIKNKKWYYLLILGVGIIGFLCIIIFNPRVKYLFNLRDISMGQNIVKTEEGVIVRFLIIREAMKIIGENIWLGTGTGDVKDALIEKYKQRNIHFAFVRKLNSHNQFLETFIGLGIPGFLALLVMLFYPLYIGIKDKNILLVTFLLIVTTNFLFESMLNTQAGVVFFAFFYSLLTVQDDPQKIIDAPQPED